MIAPARRLGPPDASTRGATPPVTASAHANQNDQSTLASFSSRRSSIERNHVRKDKSWKVPRSFYACYETSRVRGSSAPGIKERLSWVSRSWWYGSGLPKRLVELVRRGG